MSKNRPNNSIIARTVIVAVFLGIIMFVPMVLKLYALQIVDYEFYQTRAKEQQTRDTIITPKRGEIYDRNLNELAVSATAYTINVSPADIKNPEDEQKTAKALSEILGVDYEKLLSRLQNKKSYYYTVKKRVDNDLTNKIRQAIIDQKLRGIHFEETTKRYYPYGVLASQVLGFCGDAGGSYGVELFYDKALKGEPGRVITMKNARGEDMPFKYEEYADPKPGEGVVLTIDKTIQQITEKYLATAVVDAKVANRGAAIVMDVTTGEILAMSAKGDFDPNKPFEIIDTKKLTEIQTLPEAEQKTAKNAENTASFRNKVVSDSYEPGSVFKIITTAMALEEGVVTPDSKFTCNGFMKVANYTIKCHAWKKGGHGTQNLSQALENSCNVAYMLIGQRIGNEKFYEYFNAFGFREKTGIDLPGEANGVFFSKKDFVNPKNIISLSVAAFGQTFKVTPIQVITAISAVVNGGNLMKPHLVKEYVDEEKITTRKVEPELVRQVISKETSAEINKYLERVVSQGTGRNARVLGYRIGGKTGTSEKIAENLKESDVPKYVASFVGVAPIDNPKIAILVLLDEPRGEYYEGSQVAAPVVGRIMGEVLPYLGIEPVYSTADLVGVDVEMPDLIGKTPSEARKIIGQKRFSGLRIRIVGDDEKITGQIPPAGTKVPNTAQVVAYCGINVTAGEVTVPNIIGMEIEQVNKVITDAGLYLKVVGAVDNSVKLAAAKQSIAPGTKVKRGTVITVEFYDFKNTTET